MPEDKLPEVQIRLNWALEIHVGAAYCFQLEYLSKPPVIRQIAELSDLIPDETNFGHSTQNHEIALQCFIHALKSLKRPCKANIISYSHFLLRTLERMPAYMEDNFLEGHDFEAEFRQLWEQMQRHQIEFIFVGTSDKTLKPLRHTAENKLRQAKQSKTPSAIPEQ